MPSGLNDPRVKHFSVMEGKSSSYLRITSERSRSLSVWRMSFSEMFLSHLKLLLLPACLLVLSMVPASVTVFDWQSCCNIDTHPEEKAESVLSRIDLFLHKETYSIFFYEVFNRFIISFYWVMFGEHRKKIGGWLCGVNEALVDPTDN